MTIECHYEVLGVAQDCDDKDLTKAYRKMAMKWHPDRNFDNQEEATVRFKLIQEAYETLSDKHERAWYDSHRTQILRGFDHHDLESKGVEMDHLYAFFSTRAYKGISNEKGGFYAVYRKVFLDIDEAEGGDRTAPLFGGPDASWREVKDFYAHFTNFVSKQDFSLADKWKLADADNRQIRRLMEKENKKLRTEQRRKYNALIRRLASWLKRRDPRVTAHEMEVAKRKEEERKRREEEEKAEQERIEQARQEEYERIEKLRETNPELFETSSEEPEPEPVDVYKCICCNKEFKSEKALENHKKSKKHKANFKKMQRSLMEDEQIAGVGSSQPIKILPVEPEPEPLYTKGPRRGKKKKKKKKWKQDTPPPPTPPPPEEEEASTAPTPPAQPPDEDETEEKPAEQKNETTTTETTTQQTSPAQPEQAADEEADQAEPEPEPEPEPKGKKRRRRRKTKAEKKQKAESVVHPLACKECKVQFETRNQLFKHLKSNPRHALAYRK